MMYLRLLVFLLLAGTVVGAMPESVEVRLVTDFESGQLISDLEQRQPVVETVFDPRGTREVTVGTRATLWVRNAHVDNTFFFERYYQGKYIGRSASLTIPTAELEPGTHTIQPGNHSFSLAEDGTLSSEDPDIRVEGAVVMLRCYPVDVHAVDAAKGGPSDLRLVPADLGVFATEPDFTVDAEELPNPRNSRDPRQPSGASPITNLVSHSETFLPLRIWLPSNEVGEGYLLFPSWQAFHLMNDGSVALAAAGAPRVPGIRVEGGAVVIPHRRFSGKLQTYAGLGAGVGNVSLGEEMLFGATLAPVRFRAGRQSLDELSLGINTDLSLRPYKHFVADNMTGNPDAIRLLALEWELPVWTRGSEAEVAMRFLQSPEAASIEEPVARVRFSPYDERAPARRVWQEVETIAWENGREAGSLRFHVPDRAFGFGVIEIAVIDAAQPLAVPTLVGEVHGCIVEPNQIGTASVITNHARDAFVAGEEIALTVVLRSREARAAGARQIVLEHPDGHQESVEWQDSGAPQATATFRIAAAQSTRLLPGRYTLRFNDLPAGVIGVPFSFDVVPAEPVSNFLAIKPSKYTKPMNNLVPSHYSDQVGAPVDLERAVETMAELGYNRIDLMTYITNHHLRRYTWRESLAEADRRLPAAGAVFTPKPRHQLLNAATRHGLQFSDVFLSYNDFHLPRYIEGYTQASQRWLAREMQDMRASPATDGIMLYDEMYDSAVSGLVEGHQKLWNDIRYDLATEAIGKSPAKIEEAISRFMARPESQRDPQALEDLIAYKNWQQLGWQHWVSHVVQAGREVMPDARYGTFRRTWMGMGHSDTLMHGYSPDLFEPLDIISHVHYADNSTSWVHVPMIAQVQRVGEGKTLYVNLPVSHEGRTQNDGQYQRMMAFALLAQGADGVSLWGVNHEFNDGPNRVTLIGKETTRQLNADVLQPLGHVLSSAGNGYQRVGIVSTMRQHALGEFKDLPTGHQTEEIWVACWRLGYPAVFVREADFAQPLEGFEVLFVPGIRFAGELTEPQLERLEEAIAAGTKVVVEDGSKLDLPGVIRLDDWALNSFYLGKYFPTWMDDELNKVYEHSQKSTDYLRVKFAEWGVEPSASGPFRIGPSWRDGGAIQYLVMANFDDPEYPHTVKQQMARPVRMPLEVEASRGAVAVDLLAREPLPLQETASEAHRLVTLDMTRTQGAIAAFLPAPIEALQVRHATSADQTRLRLRADLLAQDGPIDGIFPTRITLGERSYYRTLGRDREASFTLPARAGELTVKVEELISGETAELTVRPSAGSGQALVAVPLDEPRVPFPREVQRFWDGLEQVRIIVGDKLPGAERAAESLAGRLRQRGVTVEVLPEGEAWQYPNPMEELRDPYEDGFHSWRGNQELIGPAVRVNMPVILLAAPGSSYLLDQLAGSGFLTEPPMTGAGQPARPSLQLAQRAFHAEHGTLCLIAADATGLDALLALLQKPLPVAQPAAAASFGDDAVVRSATTAPVTEPAAIRLSTNEMIRRMGFDGNGNLYISTWGFGNNLYSFAADGEHRFSKYLPQMGIRQMEVAEDRVFAYTAAGARLYQIGFDGEALSQVRLNMDPGSVHYRDEYGLSSIDYAYLPRSGQIIHRGEDRMRRLDTDMNILAEWRSETFVDKDVSDEEMRRGLHDFAVSPDGTRIAQIETSSYFTRVSHEDERVYDSHLVIRDLDGKLLHEYQKISNTLELNDRVAWPPSAPGPMVRADSVLWQFNEELEIVRKQHTYTYEFYLGDGRRLMRDGQSLLLVRDPERVLCAIGPFALMPTVAVISEDGSHIATLDEDGGMRLFATADGGEVAAWQVPEVGSELIFAPDGESVLLGSFRGGVFAYSLAGELQWRQRLAHHNTIAGDELPLHDESIVDHTEKIWPVQRARAGELEETVRLSENRLRKQAYTVGEEMEGESITEYLGRHVTWVLEFRYRAVNPEEAPLLVAGIRADSRHPDSTVLRRTATAEWQFGRLAIKNGVDCRELAIGFSGKGGQVQIADATFRRLRFPSVNHLAYEPLHEVTPVTLTNPLFLASYDPFGNTREEAPNRVMVSILRTGTPNLVEAAFLQNGRINDVGSKWYVQPFPDTVFVTLTLKEPRWISMLALYFDTYDAENVMPHFDILATDMETSEERLLASVRHNGQLFRIVKFPPIKTPQIKIRLVNSIRRLRTLSEVEAYGPLSGQEGAPGFADAEGQNAYMGNFARVDTREKELAPTFEPPILRRHGHGDAEIAWNPPVAQILAGTDRFFVSRALGYQDMYELANPTEHASLGRANGLGFTPYGTLYGGLLLRAGNDGKLYCISPETGTTLWSVPLGERLFGSPVAIAEDVFMANESGRLYQLDLANGSIMRDTPLGGGVYGSPATDGEQIYLITDNGRLQAHRVDDLSEVWSVAVAPYTESTPAVDNGVVYMGDQQGHFLAVQAASGEVLWRTELGQEFERCPVVLEDRLVVGLRGGKLAVLNRADGALLWERAIDSRFNYEPMVLGDRILYFEQNKALTLPLAGGGEPEPVSGFGYDRRERTDRAFPFVIESEPMASLSYYKGHIFAVPRQGDSGHTVHRINFAWHVVGGRFYVLAPKPPASEATEESK